MKAIVFAAACLCAIGPAFAGHYGGFHFGGGRLVSGQVGVVRMVRPAGVRPAQMMVAPRPAAWKASPYTGRKIIKRSAKAN